nr:PREDICTED: cyclic AMP-responsive element-binding protein 3-like protein 1 [Latimeria chalumnae]|eukprot:XP_005987033.1 PREDICTED: cyclic AMP-responsive element-binding protein 3-like protein 1 [Latimeria chalumnae]
MDAILDNFPSEKLFSSPNLLDLEDLNEADFLNNVHFSENMDYFSNELFNSFFEDPLLAEKNSLLDMDMDPPTPDIQAEHSYSLSGDSAPQSPVMPMKMDEAGTDSDSRLWSLGTDLSSLLVKQEQTMQSELPAPHLPGSVVPPVNINPMPQRLSPAKDMVLKESAPLPPIKVEPRDVNQFLNVPADELVQLPLTPPSSHSSDSDGSQSPRSLPPSSPVRPQARSSTAISSSPLLTAPHISAQESRRKKKEYVECLEKKTLLQQLQKLQALVAGKVPRSCKMAATQTGTCLMVVALCFVLVLGSFMPCLPEFSSLSQTVKTAPLSSPEIYTASHIRSRSLMFYDESSAAALDDRYSAILRVEHSDGWEAAKEFPEELNPRSLSHEHLDRAHEATKYLRDPSVDTMDLNRTQPRELIPLKDKFHESPDSTSEFL